jgi:hypothetical protein
MLRGFGGCLHAYMPRRSQPLLSAAVPLVIMHGALTNDKLASHTPQSKVLNASLWLAVQR